MNPYSHAASLLPGLPATRLSPSAQRSGATRNARLGATQSRAGTRPTALPAIGQPSLRLIRADSGVRAELTRRIPHADLLTPDELAGLQRLAKQAQSRAERLSQGGLSLRALARRGHPYGRGKGSSGKRGGLGRLRGSGRGVSNLAVVNRQSGELARSWSSALVQGKDGVKLVLSNSAEHARLVAFGTKTLRAHGPFLAAQAQLLPAINQEVMRLARVAKERAKYLSALEVTG